MSNRRRKYEIAPKKVRNAFVLGTSAVILLTVGLAIAAETSLVQNQILKPQDETTNTIFVAIMIGLASALVGSFLFRFAFRLWLEPVNHVLEGMSLLAEGKYDTRISINSRWGMSQMQDGFNRLAGELQNVEILRSDFINNFSHEFKTPLVSIRGLAGLMKSKELPREKQITYLDIIEEEAKRLSFMTTNVLQISKLENQTILTDRVRYNLSEQLRRCLLLLEKQWSQKDLSLMVEFDEFYVVANEDMMSHVWVNLLDNAIKFADNGGSVLIDITQNGSWLTVKVGNTGPAIPPEEMTKIFTKFYQVDQSHAKSGNGIGLSIAKYVIELHKGTISVSRDEEQEMTVFSVEIPCAM
ncbi:MAG: HAMP domain-containing histidine kinase [Clostridia bacterium]|nr:HAMP domain-containing histidine kinase [Clostridia bacterium]